ncbi:unnamed protein product [Caenorhabditis brenneri]
MFSPMSYPNLPFIVQYLEANKRIELARRCPLIKTVDKLVPLRIESIEFRNNILRINDTYYQIGVVQEFTDGHFFEYSDKSYGGMQDDVNEYGCKVATNNHILTPGDIAIPPVHHDENVINMEEEPEFLEKLEDRLKNNTPPITEKVVRYYLERELYSRRCQFNRELPSSEFYLLLTIHRPDRPRKWEAVKYNKKIYEAMKNLTTQIFGGRKHVVYVNLFDVFFPVWDTRFGSVLRLPESLKFKISRLAISSDVEQVLNGLSPILDSRSFPLEGIKVIVTEDDSYFPSRDPRCDFKNSSNHEHPAVQSAKSLCIATKYSECFEFVLKARNPNIRLDARHIPRADLLKLIKKILKEEWRQEISYCFGIEEKEHLYAAVEKLMKRYHTWIEMDDEEGEKCFIRIHINSVKDLCLDFAPIPEGKIVETDHEAELGWLLQIYTGERKDPGVVENVLIAANRARMRFDDLKDSFRDVMRLFRR